MRRDRAVALSATIAMVASAFASVGATPAGAVGESVLFVTGFAGDLPTADGRLVDIIEGAGITVVLADDDTVSESDADSVTGVVISSSVVPSKMGQTFRTTPKPLVVLEPFQFSELAMTRSGNTNRGEAGGKNSIAVVRPDHPLAAGLSGSVAVTSSNAGVSWGRVVQDGTAIATVPGASARAAVFVYEAGAQMHNLVAPAMRVGLFPSFNTGNVLTSDGEALVAAAVTYAVGGDAPEPVNQPPFTNAGADRSIVTDSGAADVDSTVIGTVSDDGLPLDPGAVSVQWSGPAGVSFASPTSATSDVTLPGLGSYSLVLEAFDGELLASDVVVLTVEETPSGPSNVAPTVDAGADVTVTDASPISFTATASDDGLPVDPGSLSLSWAGPSGVAFGSPNSATTSVTTSGPGVYTLTFSASDGDLTSSDSMTLTVEATSPPDGEFDIIFMAVNATGASAEQDVIQRLRDAGHTVTVVDDNQANPADAGDYDLIVVSASISPSTFDSPWATSSTPMVVWESKVYDDLGMTKNNTTGGFAGSQRDIRILDATHPITAGFAGIVRITASTRSIAWGQPKGDVRLLASLKSTSSKASIFTYEPGDAMEDGVAPARRVGMFLSVNSGQVMTNDGWTLFDRAIAWAAATPSPAPVAAAAADITSGAVPQGVTFDATGSSGSLAAYDWDFGDGGTASGMQVSHTFVAGGTYAVVLTVTDDEGRTDSDTVTLVFDDGAPGGGRVEPIARYDFVEGARADYVDDVSGVGVPLDLRIGDTANVTWLPNGGLSIDAETGLESDGPAEKITAAVKATEEITIEAWVDPISTTQSGPARIVALTNGNEEENDINAMLGQGYKNSSGDRVEGRFFTSNTTDHGQPGVLSRDAALDGDLVHLVFTRAYTGVERIYVNGSLSGEWHVSGDPGVWDITTPLLLANELNRTRPWLGVFHRVQIYDRAIPSTEVCSNLAAGPGHSVPGNDAPYPCLVLDSVGGVAPHTINFDASDSVDLDGTIVSRTWTFGDGTNSSAMSPSHTFTAPGRYDVSLRVTDNQGKSRTAAFTVDVDDPLPRPAPTIQEASGMRVGNGFFNKNEHEAREAWLGRELNWTAQFTSHHSAQEMGSSSFGLFAHRDAGLPKLVDRMNVVIAVGPAFGFKDLKNGGPAEVRKQLVETIRGDNDFLYYRAAARMVDAGYGDAVVRIGHEFNSKWPPWAAEGNEDAFIAAYRHVVTLFRNVSPDFTFDFSAFKRKNATTVPPAYPGDDYVDIISLSMYWKNVDGNNPWRESKWDTDYRQNLEAMRDFAISHGKPLGVAEWGIQGLDEPRFIQRMYDFMITLPASGPGHMLYNVYWDSGASTSRLDNLPAVKTKYKQLFG